MAGWSYLASYYRTFGVNPIELDVPVPVAATMALHMLYQSVWPLPVMAIAILVFVGVVHRYDKLRATQRWWVVGTLIVFIFCSAIAALVRGRYKANADMMEESSDLPLVAFSSTSPAMKLGPPEQPSCVGYETFGAMDCKLLLHSRGLYFFFQPISKAKANKSDKVDLFILPDSGVSGVHLQRGIDVRGLDK